MERGGDEFRGDFGLHDSALFYDPRHNPVHPRESDPGFNLESWIDHSKHHRDDELECILWSNVLRDWSA